MTHFCRSFQGASCKKTAYLAVLRGNLKIVMTQFGDRQKRFSQQKNVKIHLFSLFLKTFLCSQQLPAAAARLVPLDLPLKKSQFVTKN